MFLKTVQSSFTKKQTYKTTNDRGAESVKRQIEGCLLSLKDAPSLLSPHPTVVV
jgi:hypothetical protein